MKYELATLKDIFDKVPADRIKSCLHELAIAMEQAKAMRELLNAVGKAVAGDSVDVDFSWPEMSTWIDDGKGKIDLKFLDHDRTELFDCRLQLNEGSNT